MRIVSAAAEYGADAIKLQTFTPASLTIDSSRAEMFISDPLSPWYGRRLWDLYEEAHTPWDWHAPLFKEARAHGLACISTAFDSDSLLKLVDLDVDAVKISSFELVHLPLIEAAARLRIPLIISTGMASLDEITEAVDTVRGKGCEDIVLLKCTSAYPSTESDANVSTIGDLRSRFKCHVGLSDHTLTPYAAYAATALGACMIEKHFTVDRSQAGVDAAFSIEPAELRELVAGTELVWRSVGAVAYGPLVSEASSLSERPSIYIVSQVRKGDIFTVENIRVIRPGAGLPPKHYGELLGRKCKQDIAGPVPMSWEFVE